ncbi:FAD-dependent oxidoreductase [Thalassotalea ganghwensis]
MDIAILGGGVTGLATAIALKQRHFNVTIYERHSQIKDIGAGIVCWPNACFVLEQLGVLTELKQLAGHIKQMQRLSSTNESLGCLDVQLLNKQMGFPSLSILRRDLMKVLAQRANTLGIKTYFDHEVKTIETVRGNAKVNFAQGKALTADIIIGAEGRMNSPARTYVNGSNYPIYQGFINWVGVATSNKPLFKNHQVLDFWGVGHRFGIVPISTYSAYWAGGACAKHITTKDPSQYVHELMSIFSDWPAPIMNTIALTPNEDINKIFVHDHQPISCWHKNNVILMGDSAHAPLPTSGQGACQALEDAWHFSECLKANTSDIGNVFQRFTALRFEKTTSIINSGRNLASSIFNSDEFYCQQRNLASKRSDFNAMINGMAKGWSQGLPLKNTG